jgi:hypothetical protein
MTLTGTGVSGNAAWWCVLLVFCLVLFAPLTLADVPPLLDYPNHLARLFVLAFIADDPVLARFYQPHWEVIPNLGLDLIVPPLLRLFPVHVVGRVVIAVVVLLPVFGTIAYHRALTGRLSYLPLASTLFAYNGLVLRGFLNFEASLGLALLLAAAWVAWRERRSALTIMTGVAGAVALFFCHLIGLVLFAILIGAHELMVLRTSQVTFGWLARRFAGVLVVFLAPVALYLVSDLSGMEAATEFRSVIGKAHAALMPVINYSWPLDLATAVLCVCVPVFCLVRRWCVARFQAPLAIIVLLVLFVGLPAGFKGTYDLDSRFIVMAAFVFPAALIPIAMPLRAARVMGVLFLILFGARTAVLMTAWQGLAADLAAFRTVVASVQPGDAVMLVRLQRIDKPNIWTSIATEGRLSDLYVNDTHLPALLLIEHRAWWPFLFDNASQQPIRTREPYRTAALMIDAAADPVALLAQDPRELRVLTHVLIMHPHPDEVMPAGLKLVARNYEAALFAIERDVSPPQPPSPRPVR